MLVPGAVTDPYEMAAYDEMLRVIQAQRGELNPEPSIKTLTYDAVY